MRIFCISSGGNIYFFSRYQAMLVMCVFKIQKGEQVMKLEEAENFEQLEGKDLEEQAGDMDFDEEQADSACDIFEDTGFDVTAAEYSGWNPFLRFRQWCQMRKSCREFKKAAEVNRMYTGRGF